jgi:hypothetical protein
MLSCAEEHADSVKERELPVNVVAKAKTMHTWRAARAVRHNPYSVLRNINSLAIDAHAVAAILFFSNEHRPRGSHLSIAA